MVCAQISTVYKGPPLYFYSPASSMQFSIFSSPSTCLSVNLGSETSLYLLESLHYSRSVHFETRIYAPSVTKELACHLSPAIQQKRIAHHIICQSLSYLHLLPYPSPSIQLHPRQNWQRNYWWILWQWENTNPCPIQMTHLLSYTTMDTRRSRKTHCQAWHWGSCSKRRTRHRGSRGRSWCRTTGWGTSRYQYSRNDNLPLRIKGRATRRLLWKFRGLE